MFDSLKDRYGDLALVTGASDGIGRAFAIELAKNGLNLILVARRRELLEALRKELSSTYSVKIDIIAHDVSTENGRKAIHDAIVELKPGLLVAAAGFGTSGSFIKNSLEHELNMIDVNCRAVTEQTYAMANMLKERGKGGIILFGSLVAFQGVPWASNYAATKAFVQTLAEGLYWELKPLNIDVLAIAPGPVNSGFGNRADMQIGNAAKPETVAKVSLEALGKQAVVRPGFLSKFLEYSLTLPRPWRTRIMGMVMRGMTKHHH